MIGPLSTNVHYVPNQQLFQNHAKFNFVTWVILTTLNIPHLSEERASGNGGNAQKWKWNWKQQLEIRWEQIVPSFGTPVISCTKQIVMILGLFKGLMKQS